MVIELAMAIEEFGADLQLAGRAAGTIEKHRLELLRLGRWCNERGAGWHQLVRRELQIYVRLRADTAHSTRANMLCTLRTFYRWPVEQEYVSMSPATGFKTPIRPRPLPRSLNREHVAALLTVLSDTETKREHRDRVILLTALYAGLRCREIAELQWSHVDLRAALISIAISKMGKGRVVPMHPELRVALVAWRIEQLANGSGPVFSLDGHQFKPTRVGKIASAWSKRSGVYFSAHMLRHTFATWSLRGSKDVYAVSKALGHSQLRQTEVYVSADTEQVRAAIGVLPGLDAW